MPAIAAQLLADLPRADVLQVLEVFGNEVRRILGVLPIQAEAQDREAFRRSAHALAGAAGAIGAARLEAVARTAMTSFDAPDLSRPLAAIREEADSALADAQAAAASISGTR